MGKSSKIQLREAVRNVIALENFRTDRMAIGVIQFTDPHLQNIPAVLQNFPALFDEGTAIELPIISAMKNIVGLDVRVRIVHGANLPHA